MNQSGSFQFQCLVSNNIQAIFINGAIFFQENVYTSCCVGAIDWRGDGDVADLFEGHVGRGAAGNIVDGTFLVDGPGAVDLAVGALADLLEADVVGDGAGGEGPAVEGVVRGGEGVRGGGQELR